MSFAPALLALSVDQLPAVNAALNATAAMLLVAGYLAIRQKRERLHKAIMLTAFCVSVAFLVSYLIYHAQEGSHRFGGPAPIRAVYLVILFSHVVLAASVPVLATVSIYLGLSDRRAAHRKVVRWTLPIWLYVSITGVLVYWMLYHLYPISSADVIILPRWDDSWHHRSVSELARTPSRNDMTAERLSVHDSRAGSVPLLNVALTRNIPLEPIYPTEMPCDDF